MDEEIGRSFPLLPVNAEWLRMIDRASEAKDEGFWKYAEEALNFYDGPHTFMWDEEYQTGVGGYLEKEYDIKPRFKMQVNRVSEFVDLFTPSVYHQNPYRSVKPRLNSPIPPEAFGNIQMDPMAFQAFQQLQMEDFTEAMRRTMCSTLMHDVLNYTPNELNLKYHSRRAIEEAIITGMGCVWHQVYQPHPGSTKLVGSFYQPIKTVQLDPDAELWDDVKWMAIECTHPIWEVEKTYGIPPGMIKKLGRGNWESIANQARNDPMDRHDRRTGESSDLITYWKIFSKMGFGDRGRSFGNEDLKGAFDEFGDFCYLVIAKDVPFPLNFNPWVYESGDLELMKQTVAWPIPFWADGKWPISPLWFKTKPGNLWPISHVKPGIGELRFLNWAYSFLADKVAASSMTVMATVKAAGQEMKKQLFNGECGIAVVEIEEIFGNKISDVVSYIQAPPFNGDIYNVIAAVEKNFDRRMGTSDILYGLPSGTQDRSAAESSIKQGNATIRIEDMKTKAEDWQGDIARSEALMSRWVYEPEDLLPIFGGQMRVALWQQYVMTDDIMNSVREYEYRIESGSMAKPNIATDAQQMNEAVQVWGPALLAFAQMGQIDPLNQFLLEWGKSRGRDMSPFLIKPPQVMPQPGQPGAQEEPPPQQQAA